MTATPAQPTRPAAGAVGGPPLSRRRALAYGGGAVVAAGLAPGLVAPAHAAPGSLERAFEAAAARFGVPRDLLVAIGYTETRLDDHGGRPSFSGGYGLMHLVRNPKHHTLDEAAAASGIAVRRLRTDAASNIVGAAAVLDAYATERGLSRARRRGLDAWYPVVARYSGARDGYVQGLYADAVYATLADGASANGVTLLPRSVDPDRSGLMRSAGTVTTQSTDYPPAHWVAAAAANYTDASRPGSHPIRRIVVHTTQGSYAGAISWFQNSAAKVSAHYVLRSSDGDVTQCVRDADIGWHAGNWSYNETSIGLEHEGYVSNASWYTEAMYRSSAALTRHLCTRYGIARTRTNIIGHSEVPGATHTDPGPSWNWSHYMALVNGSTTGRTGSAGWPTLRQGQTSTDVRVAQHLLNQRGAGLTVDGAFGPATVTAVRSFQSGAGLTSDGVVGPLTWAKLVVQRAQGSTGAAVRGLQTGLNKHGAGLTVDGSFGTATDAAVRSFQRNHGLTVDGIAGAVTWEWIV